MILSQNIIVFLLAFVVLMLGRKGVCFNCHCCQATVKTQDISLIFLNYRLNMDHIILHIQIRRARDQRRRLELYRARVRKIRLRDAADPFSMPENEFRNQFRLPRVLARRLVDEITPFLREAQRATAIPAHIKVNPWFKEVKANSSLS